MRRRTLLGAAGGLYSALAGCATLRPSTDTGTATETTTGTPESAEVAATFRWYGGLSSVNERRVRAERGELTYAVSMCDETTTETRSLPESDYDSLRSLVLDTDPSSWASEYPCEDVCATDDGMYELRVSVDEATYGTRIDPMAEPPKRVQRVVDELDSLAARFEEFETPECGPAGSEPTDR
jgi:hypothetical protein